MESNSKIYSSSLFGRSSGLTATELAQKNTSTIETAILKSGGTKMNNVLPRVPSNQDIAKDK